MKPNDDGAADEHPKDDENSSSLRSIAREITPNLTRQNQQSSDSYDNMTPQRAWGWLNLRVRWLFVLNLIVAIGTASQAYVAYRSLAALNRTNDMTAESLRLTRESIAVMNEANAVSRAQTGTSAKAASAAEAANQLTNQNITQTLDMARLDQRAWVTLKGARFDDTTTINKFPSATVFIENTGKSPALDLTISTHFQSRTSPLPNGPIPVQIPSQRGVGVLAPNTVFNPTITATAFAMTDETIAAYKAKRLRFFVYGRVEYRDIFGDRHVTDFCFEASADLPSGASNVCGQWNRAS